MTSEPQNNEEYSYTLKIPKDRVAVLIGTKGKEKRMLENATKTKIDVDSKEGEVVIEGKDAITLFVCREIVLAIGRGFSPEIAKQLLKQDYGIEILNIKDYSSTDKEMIRLKGRVIGEEGKGRKTIEELTGTNITVYGKTIGIIGELETVPIARRAIEMMLEGARHATVFRWLEQRRQEIRHREFTSRDVE
jgi:ribosomal RNA assembly protein